MAVHSINMRYIRRWSLRGIGMVEQFAQEGRPQLIPRQQAHTWLFVQTTQLIVVIVFSPPVPAKNCDPKFIPIHPIDCQSEVLPPQWSRSPPSSFQAAFTYLVLENKKWVCVCFYAPVGSGFGLCV